MSVAESTTQTKWLLNSTNETNQVRRNYRILKHWLVMWTVKFTFWMISARNAFNSLLRCCQQSATCRVSCFCYTNNIKCYLIKVLTTNNSEHVAAFKISISVQKWIRICYPVRNFLRQDFLPSKPKRHRHSVHAIYSTLASYFVGQFMLDLNSHRSVKGCDQV